MRILTALDGSNRAESVLPLVACLGRRDGTRTTLLRVTERLCPEPYSLPAEVAADLKMRMLKTSIDYLAEVRERMAMPALSSLSLIGQAVQQICQKSRDYDLIVMTAQGETGATTGLGSVTDGILRASSCPVLVIRPPAPSSCDFRHILIPIDGSANSLAVTQMLGPYLSNHTKISLVAATGLALRQTVDKIDRRAWQTYTQRLEDNLLKVRLPGVKLVVKVVDGDSKQAILSWAVASKCDLIAMASHGSNRMPRYLLGSVTQTVVRQAPCSVLVFPPPQPPGVPLSSSLKRWFGLGRTSHHKPGDA